VGYVGDDTYGQLVLRRLQACGVNTDSMTVAPQHKTGLTVALARGGDRSMLTYGGTINAVSPDDVSDAFLQSGRHLHYGSYYLLTRLLPVSADIVRRAKAFGLSVSIDTNWDPDEEWDGGLRDVLSQADLFMPNEREALAIAGRESIEGALDALSEYVPLAAVKLGSRGALVARGEERYSVPTEPADQVLDTIGAGDSFDAGFIAGWLRGLELSQCAAIGNYCGRATTQARGGIAGQVRLADIPLLARKES
jgi:sugar/nucleoside kinase (ribokinase family)